MSTNNYFARAAAAAFALTLGGCLISDEPLLDAKNGRGRPMTPGLYDVCEYSEDESEPDCKKMEVTRDATGLYRQVLHEDEDDVTFTRFKRVARGAWLAQLSGEDDDDYFYFFGKESDGEFAMTLMNCPDLPEALREKYAASGDMDIDDDATVCTLKALRAAVAAAKFYNGSDAPPSRSRMIYKRVGELED